MSFLGRFNFVRRNLHLSYWVSRIYIMLDSLFLVFSIKLNLASLFFSFFFFSREVDVVLLCGEVEQSCFPRI